MSDVICTFENVFLEGGSSPRLDDVSVKIHHGITAVIGSSGAGKTSLLNLMVRFEKPNRGTISNAINNKTAPIPLFWVPQDGGLWPHLTVSEHVQRVTTQNTAPLLERFDLDHKASAYPHDLSQGERARLSVVRALATQAAFLVMDEPLAHVDAQRLDKYWRAILESVKASSSSLVFATHSPRTVLAYAAQAICIDAAQVLYAGAVDTLYHHPPSEQLASSLGRCNWLTPDDSQLWLGTSNGRAHCYRPQQISIVPDHSSNRIVKDRQFYGDVVEVSLEHEPTGEHHKFVHCSSSPHVNIGDHVSVRLLMLLLLISLMFGCTKQQPDKLDVAAVHTWQFPSDGPSIPAPRNIAVDDRDRVIVLDTAGRVLIFNESGKVIQQWRMPTNKAGNPEGACVLRDGRVAVADTHYSRVVMFDPKGNVQSTFGKNGKENGQFQFPVSIVQDDKDFLYVCEYGGNDRVQKFTPQGKFIEVLGSTGKTPLTLHYPYDLCIARDGLLYVVEYGAGRVTCVGLDGKLHGRFGHSGINHGQFRTPWGIGVNSKMRLLVADTGNHRIVELQL